MARTKQLRATMILAENAKPLTIEIASQMFFGMPFEDAIRAIRSNKNGEYDWLLNVSQSPTEEPQKKRGGN